VFCGFDIGRKIIMSKTKYIYVLIGALLLIIVQGVLINECFSMGKVKEPTAIVIDDETGKPIDGAVAIAIWRKHNYLNAWFEGGTEEVVKIEESVSDKEGRIYINGFFGLYLFSQEPHLTIYKFGYVCWDQEDIYITDTHTEKRIDFNLKHRTARLKKWPEGFSFLGHESFIDAVTSIDFPNAREQLFLNAYESETPYVIKENRAEDAKRNKLKK
jgi:hypothetical protein